MHDDVHGTAVVTLAAAIAACRLVGQRLDQAVIGQIGLGAAGFGIATLIKDAGVERVIASIRARTRRAAAARGIEPPTAGGGDGDGRRRRRDERPAGPDRAVAGATGQVILALTNPDPEIDPDVAIAAGAAFAADGTVVNNVLGYPGIFRGALRAGATAITTDMKRAAAWALAGLTVESELVPDVLDPEVHQRWPTRCAR